MAFSRISLVILLLFIITVHVAESRSVLGDIVMNNGRSLLQYPPQLNCNSACQTRCSRNWRNKMCLKMCGACCSKCNCVPPGTGQDTRNVCPCYDQMRNPRGQLKCP
ncbi:hypothetical protein LUZ61_020611 [Rhynchospora tenuis]|uniref:Snakin-2 n=1 Tax=Rhynchospora tenuis TaxID=198213 RepID=A0AAD5ZDB0_9POAL|nr:hypothetical protein LUZ61_020611 [Rhynchospora tenuis]